MKYTLQEKLNAVQVSRLIEAARDAELCRDFDASQRILSEVWSNIENEPDFSEFDPPQQADLYRIAGFFLSSSGKAKNLKFYQERGKNLITRAIEIFSYLNNKEKAAEANVMLAACYFSEGAINEAELILEQTKLGFEGDHLHPVYLQICINRMATMLRKREYQEIFKIIDEIAIPMEFCQDDRLCILYHEKCGQAYKGVRHFDKAIYHYNEAIRFSEKSNNYLYTSLNKNNLANLYRVNRNFELAHLNENEAIKIAQDYDLIGWLPHFLDTKSLIYFDEGYYQLALQNIDEAIAIFRNGEDANGLTESLWNKCRLLLHLDRKEEAILLFTELIPIATQRMGEFAVKQFTKEFSNLVHVKHGGSLDDELRRFKRVEIVNAICEANYNLFDAADLLKINVAVLTRILDKEFAELYEELDIQRFKQSDDESEEATSQTKLSVPRKISPLALQNVNFSFATSVPEQFSTFYVSSEKLSAVSEDIVVAITPIKEAKADDYVLLYNNAEKIYSFGKVRQDEFLNLDYILDKDEDLPLFLNDFALIGRVVGYCSFAEVDNDKLFFQSINF